jgi:hypothetical protein
VAEELTHHINMAPITSQMEGCPAALICQVDLDTSVAKELTHHINMAYSTSDVEG